METVLLVLIAAVFVYLVVDRYFRKRGSSAHREIMDTFTKRTPKGPKRKD